MIIHTRILSSLTALLMTANLGATIANSVFLFFAYNELNLTPTIVGFIGLFGGVAFLLGALTASRVSKKLGIGRALTLAILSGFAYVGFPLAKVFSPVPTLVFFSLILTYPVLIFNITALSMMQRVTPDRILGRVNATRRTFSWGMIPIGWLVGGILGGTIGLSATMVVGGVIAGSSALWAFFGPIYHLREENEKDAFATLKPSDAVQT